MPDDLIYEVYPYNVCLGDIYVEYAGGHYERGYLVTNVETGVLEFQSPSLPDSISLANQSAAALKFFAEKNGEDVDVSVLEKETVH